MKRLKIGEKYETKTNYKKLIQDLREQYPHDLLSTLIIETFANSMDAGATRIEIFFDEDSYTIKDNGKGMTENEFREYHNVASLTKVKGMSGIGFAGVGAKIYLDRAEHILTETKSRSFYGSSIWHFANDTPIWEVIPPRRLISNTGTFVEIKLNPQDRGKLTEKFVTRILQAHYNAALLGYYKVKEVRINGNKTRPWKPKGIEERYDFDLKIGRNKVKGFFIKAKENVPEEFQGISISVFGKTVLRNEWFKQFATPYEKITGMVMADYLISIVNTSKTQMVKTSMFWKKFHAKIGSEFSRWLEKIGAKLTPPEVSPDTSGMIKQLEKSINDVLINTPELLTLANSIFQNIVKRTTAIKNATGQLMGMEVDGSQKVSGTFGGPTQGSKVNTVGPNEGTGIVEGENGQTKIKKVKRRMKSGIRIGFLEKPDDPNEGWIDPASQTVTINTGHPAYKTACGLSVEGRVYHVWIYHLLRTIIKVLAKEANEMPESVEKTILAEWYKRSIDEESKKEINRLFPTSSLITEEM